MRPAICICAAVVGVVLGVPQARAQRAGENAVAAADDAFGTTVGTESTGLYSTSNARGFSPVQAGNVRIEGLYFDQQSQLTNRAFSGSTVRVGITAQAYPFPAPTGIADFHLRLPGDRPVSSAVVTYGPYDFYEAEVDTQRPLIAGKLSAGLVGAFTRYDNDQASKNVGFSFGAVARLTPADGAEIDGFWSFEQDCGYGAQPKLFTNGTIPPAYPLHSYLGQSWTRNLCEDSDFGVLGRFALPGGWTLRAGVFRSIDSQPRTFGDFFRNVAPNDSGDHQILALPSQTFGSYSGEVRASKIFDDDQFRHRIEFMVRGRDVHRIFGGGDTEDFGIGFVNAHTLLPAPQFKFGASNRDHTLQGTAGVGYDISWLEHGALSVGLQETAYHRTVVQPGLPIGEATTNPLLYNVAANYLLTGSVAIYGSYTRGLEDSGVAPANAANAGEAMPASLTKQVDAGFRYALTPKVKLVAGIFQVEKPYFNTDPSNVYRQLGALRHRGVEVSLSGQPVDGLTVLAGGVFMEPRLLGGAAARGDIQVAPSPGFFQFNVQYEAVSNLIFDAQLVHNAAQATRSDGSITVPAWTELNFGARYTFTIAGNRTSLRVLASNVTDNLAWGVGPTPSFSLRSPRTVKAILAADFG